MLCVNIKNNHANTPKGAVTACRSYNDRDDHELLVIDTAKNNYQVKCIEHDDWAIIDIYNYNEQYQKLLLQQLANEAAAKVNNDICNSQIDYLEESVDNETDSSSWSNVIGLISKIPSFWM